MLDRRKEQRVPAFLGGRITFDPKLSAVECIVRNTSEVGARIALNSPLIPNEFELAIPNRNATYRARVRWRLHDHIGVEFAPLSETDAPVSFGQARRLKRLELENAELRRRMTLSYLD